MENSWIRNTLIIGVVMLSMMDLSCRQKQPEITPLGSQQISIGALITLTGSGSSTGESSRSSLSMSLQNVQSHLAELGYRIDIRLIIKDTQTDTAIALRMLKEMYDEGIRLVIGPYSSSEVAHLKPFADEYGMLLVSPSSVATSLAIPDDNIFRFVTSDVIQGEAMTKMLEDDQIKVLVPVIRDDIWGENLLTALRTDFQQTGGTTHEAVSYATTTTEFSSTLSLLDANVAEELALHPTAEVAVYLACFGEGVNLLEQIGTFPNLQQVAWYGSSAFAQNGDLVQSQDAAAFAFEHGLPCPIYGLEESAQFKWQPIKDRIALEIGREPDVYALTAYDALWVGATTYAITGPAPTIDQLKQVFFNTSADFFGITGNTLLDRNGDRAHGNYDFWAVNYQPGSYFWERIAVYHSATGILTWE